MEMLPELLLGGVPKVLLQGTIGIIICLMVHQLVFSDSHEHKQFWKKQVWVGLRPEWFPKFRASLRTISGIRQMLDEGYQKYSKNGKAFILPTIAEAPWVVLPPSSMRELLSKTDAELDPDIIHAEQLQHYYTQGPLGWHAVQVPIQFDLVRRQLTRQLPLVIPIMAEEIDRSFRQYWGTQRTPVEVNVLETCTQIVTRVANRVFAGPDICQNEAFLLHSRHYSESVGRAGIIIRLLPRWLRWLLAPLITYPNRKNYKICLDIALPVVKDRLQKTLAADPTWKAPVDGLQWLLEDCVKCDDAREINPNLIVQRLLMLNFVAIETMAMSMSHTVIDLYSAPDCASFVAGLREELDRVWHEELQQQPQPQAGQWTKAGLDRLIRVDSTIRESMRVSDLSYIAVPRMVAHPAGLDFQQAGELLHIPQGVRVCVPSHAIQRDPDCYSSPFIFNPFRFSDTDQVAAGRKAPSIATTTDTFLAFGHGRHACPGRFFAAQTIKLMLAYLVQHYEMDPLKHVAKKEVQVGTARPNASLCLLVHRRD
ncbi:Ent-kaurene oxidase [Penicillium concentricum]|uniref:Ent-kaurene oxidase n=1 Tax=Penicillium concentricum TaxID=293559 RepID=A0A9W9SAD7_9EURO|nr:Ent-kaurene oxidase [Penicillium concentricum]KAJ5374370.1 Ent-kaurene oxidase [Penicillium concentricum]